MLQFEYIDPIYCRVSPPEILRPCFSYKKQFWKKGRYSKEQTSYDSFLINKKGYFLAGFLPRIEGYCSENSIEFSHNIPKFLSSSQLAKIKEVPELPGIEFRPDQIRLINTAKNLHRGVLKSPTGSGKTVIASGIISLFPSMKILFLCHTISLIKQTVSEFERFGLGPISIVGAGNKDISGRIVVSTMQSFIKIPIEEYCDKFDVVVVDECFYKKTKISMIDGEKEISDVKPGEFCYTKTGVGKVKNVFQKNIPLEKLVKVKFIDGECLYCSEDHLFFTNKGWTKAKDLSNKNGLTLFKKYINIMTNIILNRKGGHYAKGCVQEKKHRSFYTKHLSCLQRRIFCFNEAFTKILLKKMYILRPCFSRMFCKNNEKNKPKMERCFFKKNEGKQPSLSTWGFRKNETNQKNKWNIAYLDWGSRRKWQIHPTPITPCFCFRMADGSGGNYWQFMAIKRWFSTKLQSRYWQQRIKNSNRSRWFSSFREETYTIRPEKGPEIKRTRVESVEVYKQGNNDQSFQSVIGDKERNQGFIKLYDLEIEGHPSYYANSILVHNCHHVSSLGTDRKGNFQSTYPKILSTLLAPIRFGFTATLPETEEGKLALEGLIGPTIDEVSTQEGIDLGFLAKPKVKLIKVPYNLKIRNREVITYRDIYQEGIVLYRLRHRLIIEEAKKLADLGQSSLIYVSQLEHGERLLDVSNRMGLKAYFVQGLMGSEERERLRNALHKKEILVVIATVVWQEGINIKSLNNIMVAGGGKSEKALFQTIGRGFRRDTEKEEIVIYDFLDCGRYLSEHCIERLSIYSENGWI